MPTPHNDTTEAPQPLRVGLVADAVAIGPLAAAARRAGCCEIVAQSGMPQAAALPGIERVDDLRVLVAQMDVGALLVDASPRIATEAALVAAPHGVHIWRCGPLARTFAEAVELARATAESRTIMRVYSWWEHVRAAWQQTVDPPADLGPVRYSELCVRAPGPAPDRWPAVRGEVGGGVLATDGYAWLEAAYAVRGLPESAHAAIGLLRNNFEKPARQTEELALAIYRYEDGGLLDVRAMWDVPPYESSLTHHGTRGSVRITTTSIALIDANGQVLDQQPLDDDPIAADLRRFASEIAAGRPRDAAERTIERHVALSAMLEASYLSARTGQLESPQKLYEVQKWPLPCGT